MVRHQRSLSNSQSLIKTIGTWAGGIFSDRTTVVPKIFTLIADEENAIEVPFDGVGTAGGISNWIVGGMSTLTYHYF